MEEGASAEEELDLCWDDDDLSALPELDEATLLRKLHERYDRGRIYSYVGDILIAINPFRRIPLYDDKHHELYNRMDSMQDVAPHIFAIGDCAYRALCVTGSDQVVVISGESGAGKTETAKHLIRHVLQVCHSTHSDIGDQILKVNPLLESLGNAGTVMNKNSSRFGKFLRLHFTHQGTITGASLAHYLLEKSRVVQQNKSESNFHIFYQLMAGLSVEQKGRLGLTEYRDFKYLNNSGTSVDLPSQSQLRDQFDELQQAMSIVGFEESDINGLVSSIAAILHIGNLSFTDKSDKAKLLNPDLLSHVASLIGVDSAQLLAALTLQVTVACGETIKRFNTKKQAIEFRDSLAKLIYSCIFEWVISLLNTMLSPEGIDVKSSTTSIDGKTSAAPPEPSPELGDADITKVAESRRAPDICVLDIFGFENFSYNSFEQYCINIVNEQLHYYFNQCIFAWELQEYAREGIHGADGVSYTNNQETVQLFFGKPLGMLALLDEESKLQKATALTLCSKFSHNCKSHPSFVKSKQQSRPLFAIMHYAGKVDYDASSFLSKNQDTISDAIISCLQESSNEFIQTAINTHTKNQALYSGEMPKNVGNVLLKCEIPAFQVSSKSILSGGSKRLPDHQDSRSIELDVTKKKQSYRRSTKGGLNFGKRSTKRSRKSQNNGQSGKKSSTTIANFFKMSLGDLMGKMLVSMPHFVRCIKPNSKLNPNLFERDFVQRQLRYTGVLDTCRIRQAGYPVRLSFPAFMARYGHLAVRYDWMANNVMDANACKLVLEKLELKSYAIGLQKVFLRFYHNETLCHKLEHFLSAVLVCQKNARRFLAQADYLRRLEQKNVANLLSMSLQMQDDLAVALSTQCEQDDAEHRRLEEEEKRRKEEEEQRRLAEEAEKKRLAEEAEKKRLAEEAEKKRLAEEAERKRLAEEEERKRLAEEEERKLREEEERKQREEEERKQREEEERKRREEEELERQQQGADAAERTCLEKATKDSSDEVFCELEAPLASDAAKENADEDSAAREKAEEGDMFDEELEHRPSSTSSERQRPISQSHVSDSMDEDCIENEKPREVSGHPKSPLSDTSEELPMRSRRSGVAGWRQDELDDEYIPKRIRDRETFSSSQVQLAARNALLQKRLRRSSELPDSALVSHRTRSGSCQVRGAVVNRAESFESTGSAPSPGYTSRGKSFPFDDLPPPSGGIAAQNSSSFGSGLSLNATSTSKSPKSRSSFAGLIDMAQEKKKSKNKSPTWASSSRTAKHLMRNESVRSNPSGQSKDDDSKLRQDSLDFKYSTRVRASSCASGEMRSTFFFGNDSNKSSVDEDVVSISSMTRGDTLPFIEAKPDQVCDSLILSCESLCISAPSVDTMSILTVDTDEESNSALSNVRRTLVHGVEWPSISNGAVSSVTSLGVDTDEECNNQLGVSRVKTSSSSSPRLKSPLVESTGKLTQINILAPSPEVEALKREDSLARSVLPSSSKFITSDAEDDHRMSQGAVFGGDSDDEAPVRDFDKTKKRRSGADLSGKSISDEWRKLAKFANNQDSRRAMLGEKGHPDEAKDAKQSKKSRHDTLSQERERLQAEVNELVKLRDEMLLNRKISEYAKAKEEATQLQTEAEAMRSEVEQMRLDVEDDMVRASTIKECARKELMLVLAMSDLLTLKPRAVLKSVSLRHNKLASERQAPEKSPSISLCVQNSAPNSARNSWTSERNGLLGMETGSVPDLSALSLPGNVGRPGHRYSTGNISLTTRRTSPLGTKVSLAETAIHAVRQMKTRKEEAPTPKQPESVSRKFISILDQTDKESIKVAEHILLSADGSSVHKAMKSVANGSLVTSSSLANTRGEESVAPEFVPPATSVPDTRGHGAMRSSSLRKLGRQRYVQDKRQAQKPNVPSNLTTVAASMSASTPSVASAPVETAIGSLTSTSSYLDGRASCQASLGCGSTAAEATADVSAGVVRRSSFAHGQASNVAQECRKEIEPVSSHSSTVDSRFQKRKLYLSLQAVDGDSILRGLTPSPTLKAQQTEGVASTCTRSGSIDSQQIQAASNAKPLTSPVRKLVSETTQGSVSTLFSSAHTGLAAGVDPSPESIVTNTADKKPSACSVGSGSLSIGESLDDMIMQSNSCAAGVDSQFSFVGPAQSLHTPTASMSSVCSLHRSLGVTASLVGDLVSDNCTLSGPNSLTSPVSVADLESETLETEQQGIAATPAQSPEPQPTAAQPEPKAETDSKCEQDTPVEVSTSELSTSEPRSELSRFISLSASNLTSPMIARVQCQLSSSRSLGLMPASGEGEDGQRGKRRAASARIRRRSGGNLGTPTSRVRSVVRQIERGSSSSLDQTVVHTELDQFPIPRPDSSPVEERISMSRGESTEEECTDVDVEEAAEMFVDDPWCRISCMEMSYVNGVYSVFGSRLTIDGSLRQTACRLGLNSLPVAGGLTCVEEIRKYIGKGVVLDYRPDGCLYATKLTQNNVVVKGWNSPVSNCLPKSLVNRKGKLEHNIPTKIYDSALFRKHMISLINMKPVDQKMGLSICKVALAFVHDQKNPMHTPCWIVVDIIPRHHDVSAIMELHPDALAARSNDPWSAAKIIDPLMEFASHTDLSGIHRASWPMGESITDDPMFQTLGELPGSFPSSTNHLRLQPLPHNMDYLDGSTACATSKPSIETIPVHLSQDSGIPDEKHPESSSARAPNPMVEYDKISQSDSLISQAISTGGIKMSRSLTSAAVSCSSSTNVAGLFITAAASAESDDKPAPDGKAKRSFNTIVAELTSLQAATSVGLSSSSCGVAPSHSKTHAANTTTPLLSSIKQRNSKMKSNAWTRLALKTKTIKS